MCACACACVRARGCMFFGAYFSVFAFVCAREHILVCVYVCVCVCVCVCVNPGVCLQVGGGDLICIASLSEVGLGDNRI